MYPRLVCPTYDHSPARRLCAPAARRAASRGTRRLGRRASAQRRVRCSGELARIARDWSFLVRRYLTLNIGPQKSSKGELGQVDELWHCCAEECKCEC